MDGMPLYAFPWNWECWVFLQLFLCLVSFVPRMAVSGYEIRCLSVEPTRRTARRTNSNYEDNNNNVNNNGRGAGLPVLAILNTAGRFASAAPALGPWSSDWSDAALTTSHRRGGCAWSGANKERVGAEIRAPFTDHGWHLSEMLPLVSIYNVQWVTTWAWKSFTRSIRVVPGG